MDIYLTAAVRTPIGKFLGSLSHLNAPQLGAATIREALSRTQLDPAIVEEVIFGNVVQAGVGQAPARQAALHAGLPDTVGALTINKVCGSGLKAVMLATQAIKAGDANVIVAGGMESMSNAPYLLAKARTGFKYGDQKAVDALVHDGLFCAMEQWPMGNAAEHTATTCGISRGEQDRFSAQSHKRAAEAWERGDFTNEVVTLTTAKGEAVERDEGIRANSTVESLAKLKPAFLPDGTVTAANASQLSDGAAAVVVMSGTAMQQHGAKPLARIVKYAVSGVAPKDMFIAPVLAIRKLLDNANLTTSDIDLIELNEAFASQMLACIQQLELDEAKVNVNGGGIALGHPIGASGARVLVTLVHALHRRGLQRGIASLCLGGGNAVAMLVERV